MYRPDVQSRDVCLAVDVYLHIVASEEAVVESLAIAWDYVGENGYLGNNGSLAT